MKTRRFLNQREGYVLLTVLGLCAALAILTFSFFSSLQTSRRISHRTQLQAEAREGAEGALGLACAEVNRRAAAIASFTAESATAVALTTDDKTALTGAANSNLDKTSLGVKVGKFSSKLQTGTTLSANDLAYNADDSVGLTVAVRYGQVYAKASAKDPVSGGLVTSHVAATLQLRERGWFNYGFFYNMDMEMYPGPQMDVYGAVHTNADLYLSQATTGVGLYLHRAVTSAGRIYRGLKYCIKGFNADGTITGFENKAKGFTSVSNGQGNGNVYCTSDNKVAVAAGVMGADDDSLGTKTSPTLNLTTWTNLEKTRWKSYVMDKSLNVTKFSPPGLPDYVAENYMTTATTELRNHAYAMIEPQLPTTDTDRYYGRKDILTENMKWSALAGLTIEVDDVERDTDLATFKSKVNSGYGIPWKLVWYKGSSNPNAPINKENLPERDTDGRPKRYVIDPFAQNDEVDAAEAAKHGAAAVTVTMQRNLKALLRDCIVVIPYRDNGAPAAFGSGTTGATIATFPTASAHCGLIPSANLTAYNALDRRNYPAASWPKLNNGTSAFTLAAGNVVNSYAEVSYNWIIGDNTKTDGSDTKGASDPTEPANDKYPNSASDAVGAPNSTLNTYSGIYDRRQGYDGTLGGTGNPNGLQGAFHLVYIDLQKLNWILNHPALWKNPTDGTMIYTPSTSWTNILYVDLPSEGKDATWTTTRFGLTKSDKVCSVARPVPNLDTSTNPKPGYAVVLHKGGRLPRLPYDEDNRTPGFTFATNGPLYLKGNYNADGEKDTGSSLNSDQDTAGTNSGAWYSAANPDAEMPALVAADAVAFVSEGYSIKLSNQSSPTPNTNTAARYHGYGKGTGAGNTTATDADFLEISTAIVTGLTPTVPDLAKKDKVWYSGSVNNLPRFLEQWGSARTVRYRGSMAALFDCEAMTSRFIEGAHGFWFSPPTRDWGYHQFMAAGKFPPGTPVVRTTRLINIEDITAAQYTSGPPQPSE